MQRLWARMGDLFGVGFFTAYGTVEGSGIKTWGEALQAFSEEQIARGLKTSSEWSNNFPPTLPQFREMCLTVRADEPRKEAPPPPARAAQPVVDRETQRQIRIGVGDAPETVEEAYRVLGLSRRWGPLPAGRA